MRELGRTRWSRESSSSRHLFSASRTVMTVASSDGVDATGVTRFPDRPQPTQKGKGVSLQEEEEEENEERQKEKFLSQVQATRHVCYLLQDRWAPERRE